jgi:hypothetical protein
MGNRTGILAPARGPCGCMPTVEGMAARPARRGCPRAVATSRPLDVEVSRDQGRAVERTDLDIPGGTA